MNDSYSCFSIKSVINLNEVNYVVNLSAKSLNIKDYILTIEIIGRPSIYINIIHYK
jgi:hypothetical protein